MSYSPKPPQPITPNEMRELIATYIGKSRIDCSIVEINNPQSFDALNRQKELFFNESKKENHIILLYDKYYETWSTLCLTKTEHGIPSASHIPSTTDLGYYTHHLNPDSSKIKTRTRFCHLLRNVSQQESGYLALFNAFLISRGEKINDEIFDNNDKPDYSYQNFRDQVQRKRNTVIRSIPNNHQRHPQFNHSLSVTKTSANSSNSNNLDEVLQSLKEVIKKKIRQDYSAKEMKSRERLLDEIFTLENYPKNKKYIEALIGDPSLINRRSFLSSFLYKVATRSIPNNHQRLPQFNHSLSVTKTPANFLKQANSLNSNNLDELLKIQKEAIKKHISKDCSKEEMKSREKLLEERFTSENYPKNKKYIQALIEDPSLINRRSFLSSFLYKIDLPSFLTKSSTQNTR